MKKLTILFTWFACLVTLCTAAFANEYTQENLLAEYTNLAPTTSSYQKLPIYGYLIKETTFENSPEFIKNQVIEDSWKAYGAVIIQLGSDDALEVYAISEETLEKEYNTNGVPQDIATHYPRLMTALEQKTQEGENLDTFMRDNQIIAFKSNAPVNMVECSQMGIAINDEATIKSPGGRNQTKLANQDAYLRILKTDETVTGFRLIPQDLNASGKPVNYDSVDSAPAEKNTTE